jgi:hypothetical protein
MKLSWFGFIWSLLKSFNPKGRAELIKQNWELEQENIALKKENSDLRTKLYEKSEMKVAPQGYLLLDGRAYCTTCYETKDGMKVSLERPVPWNGGIRRGCPNCKRNYWDEPMKPAPRRVIRNRWVTNAWRGQLQKTCRGHDARMGQNFIGRPSDG